MQQLKVTIIPTDIMGHLRRGHFEGIIEVEDNELELIQQDPKNYYDYIFDKMNFVLDDYSIEHIGELDKIKFDEVM